MGNHHGNLLLIIARKTSESRERERACACVVVLWHKPKSNPNPLALSGVQTSRQTSKHAHYEIQTGYTHANIVAQHCMGAHVWTHRTHYEPTSRLYKTIIIVSLSLSLCALCCSGYAMLCLCNVQLYFASSNIQFKTLKVPLCDRD